MSGFMVNQSNSNNFLVQVLGNQEDIFELAVQRITFPSLRIDEALVNLGPYIRAPLAGSNTSFEDLVINIIIDEEWQAYTELYRWMRGISEYMDGKGTQIPHNRELLIHILDNKQQKAICTFRFVGVWPAALNQIELGHNDDQVAYLICPVQFKYKYFIIERNGVPLTPELGHMLQVQKPSK